MPLLQAFVEGFSFKIFFLPVCTRHTFDLKPLDSFLQQGRALLALSTGQMPALTGSCASSQFPLWPPCHHHSAAHLGHGSCFLEEVQQPLIPFTAPAHPACVGPGEKIRRRQADGKWHWEDADMAAATFLQRSSLWQTALPRTLPCRQDIALLRNSLEPLTRFSGMVPAQSCSNTLVIQAQHEWWGWTGNCCMPRGAVPENSPPAAYLHHIQLYRHLSKTNISA